MPPSQRVTRSSARLQALDDSNTSPQTDSAATTSNTTSSTTANQPPALDPPTASTTAPPTARKRKATSAETPEATREQRSSKRRRPGTTSTTASTGKAVMSSAGPLGSSANSSPQQTPRDSSRRKSSRRKSKDTAADPSSSSAPSRKPRKSSRREQDVVMKDSDEKGEDQPHGNDDEGDEPSRQDTGGGADGSDEAPRGWPTHDELDAMNRGEDPFAGGYLARFGGHSGLTSSLRALSGIVSGTHSRLRNILAQLRMKEDSSVQLIALQELSELLLVSNEDNLAGHFAPDQYVKELVALMQPNPFTGEENPEIMLLACRCIANLMEALPAATASVVYGGAVPVLCQKLLEIHFIDLAEQALSTLEKISVEFPSSIVREGGLTACLTYLDFFATSTQRTAVTTAANCCRNIPEDSFPTVRDVMPILLTTLSSSDQRVVEQASLCVSRVIDSFKFHESKLEELVSAELLKAILRLLLPGSTNLIGPSIHTQFLRVLSITARASPRLSAELLKMNVVDTLYQILTGVSPPSGTDGVAAKIDKNVIMQSIIRTPRESIFETLNVICELLPTVSQESLTFLDDLQDAGYTGPASASLSSRSKASPNDKRLELLKDCAEEVKRFAVILFPTLMHAYTSTVNLSVRQKVLTAQLKMLSNLDVDVLQEALRGVTYASHLASILSQQDNASLVTFALQAAELLLKRMESVYRPQFYREGVMAEIAKLAARDVKKEIDTDAAVKLEDIDAPPTRDHLMDEDDEDEGDDGDGEAIDVEIDVHDEGTDDDDQDGNGDDDDEVPTRGDDGDDDHDHDDHDHDDHDHDDEPAPRGDHSDLSAMPPSRKLHRIMDAQDVITLQAKRFVDAHGDEGSEQMRTQATEVLSDIQSLAEQLKTCYGPSSTADQSGSASFRRMAKYFGGDAIESITSYELMTSGIVEVLLDVFTADDEETATRARSEFLSIFMSTSNNAMIATGDAKSPSTAFSVLIYKLQDLLSRSEHFEVVTVSQNASESNRGSAASMLAKQLRLKLAADEESGIPRHFRNIMVSIHAIATFKALEDYLRPRITLSERPRGARRDGISAAMAAYAAAMVGRDGGEQPPTLPSLGSSLSDRGSGKKTKASKSDPAGQTEPGKSEEGSSRLRRSSRKQSAQASSIDTATEADAATSSSQGAAAEAEANDTAAMMRKALELAGELAGEEHNSDEDDDADIEADLDALVDDLEDGGLDDDGPDPSAVNLEVAKSGKVTARTEDGARVGTPSQGAPTPAGRERMSATARLAAARELLATPTSSSARGMSYASALQQPPQDWHIEFSVNGQPIASDTTIYRACHFNQAQGEEVSGRNIWSTTHTISFKRVPGPAPAERSTPGQEVAKNLHSNGLPPSLDEHPVTASILRLMSILHDLNLNLDDVMTEHTPVRLMHEPVTQFINAKLTAKLNRQMDEPLIVASQCLPSWSEDLARLYPFLFPFETRHLFLQSTSFGYSRLMGRWQNAQSDNESRRHRDERVFLGRVQRQKVRISRTRILESAIKVMELYGSSSSVLEVEYFEEVGTGLGPTLEFYSTVSKEFCKQSTRLWRDNNWQGDDEYAFGKHGLFPRPMSEATAANENGQRVLHLFKMLGKFVARSMLDARIIDVSFNQTFFRIGDGAATVTPSLGAVSKVDEELAKSLKSLRKYENAKKRIEEDPRLSPSQKAMKVEQIRVNDAKIEDLAMDFTLPGYPEIELQEDGANIDVTLDNVGLYIKKVIDFTLGAGVQRQVDAFRAGFSLVFPYTALKSFTPMELVGLFGRVEEDWSLTTLMDSIKADHGYNLDSKSVRNLLQVMSEYKPEQKRAFLQFVTGSPKLPIGGFRALTPMFTVVCKPSEPPYSSDDYLPSVMTCVQYLKLPDYSSVDILKAKLNVAMSDGQGAFHLS